MAKIVVFGATGYTGRRVVQALGRWASVPVVLAGRDRIALTQLSAEVGAAGIAEVSVGDDRLHRTLQRGDVLVSTVGPYTTLGHTALAAAMESGAAYLDCAGEGPFHQEVFSTWDRRARDAGVLLLTGMGADWVPGNTVGALALQSAGPGRTKRLEIEYLVTGTEFELSGGSMRTGEVLSPLGITPHAFRGGAVVEIGAAERTVFGPDGPRTAHCVTSSEHWTMPALEPSLAKVDAFLSMPALVRTHGSGPTDESRARNQLLVRARGYDNADHQVSWADLKTTNGYDYTGKVLAWGAAETAVGRASGVGALGPVRAFGIDALTAFHSDIHATTSHGATPVDATSTIREQNA